MLNATQEGCQKPRSYNDRLVSLETEIQDLKRELARQLDLLKSIMSDGSFKLNTPPKFSEIMDVVCSYYDVTPIHVVGPLKYAAFSRPRMIVYYLARKLTKMSLPQIARAMGDRDHTTILYGAKRIHLLSKVDEVLRDDLDVLELRIAEKVLNRDAPSVNIHKFPVLS